MLERIFRVRRCEVRTRVGIPFQTFFAPEKECEADLLMVHVALWL
jgi:hypothetical protein